ncbi:MAG: caspase family protein [Bacteroidaceae bacterium]|nr:caspase family protein [Bacteroidaceae bacterium]
MRTILCVILFWACLTISAQSLSQTDNSYIQFKELAQLGRESANMYNWAFQTYMGYAKAIKEMDSSNPEYQKCKNRLVEIFPYLGYGAYYYVNKNDEPMAVKYSQAYVDLSLIYALSDQNLSSKESYPLLSYFAAQETYKQNQPETAVLYYQAYLSAPDSDIRRRENAFQNLANIYSNVLKNYDGAKYIASRGMEMFPNNWGIVSAGVNACGESKDDAMLPKFLNAALRIKPNELSLLKNQGNFYERQKKYVEAINVYKKMDAIQPNNMDTYRHLGLDALNIGVVLKGQAASSTQKSEKDKLEQMAQDYFRQAVPWFQDVLDNNPYDQTIAKALAYCHGLTNNVAAWKQANKNLQAMRINTVGMGEVPAIQTNYDTIIDATPIAVKPKPEPDKFKSDVDIDIPETGIENNKTYAIIIGNENYKYKQNVVYAENDARVFAEYCTRTLGIPQNHIRLSIDAASGEMSEQIDYMVEKAGMNPGELSFIFYYSGHGFPDVSTGESYLMPVDATGTNYKYCCKLDDLYSKFHSMNTAGVTVFLDACFSGATRGGEMLFQERYVEYIPEETTVQGKVVVFSSSKGNQTSMPYDDQHHGFFTYFLLKNLKESGGSINFDNLSKNLLRDVDNTALDIKNKHQTPTVQASDSLGDFWKDMSLIR